MLRSRAIAISSNHPRHPNSLLGNLIWQTGVASGSRYPRRRLIPTYKGIHSKSSHPKMMRLIIQGAAEGRSLLLIMERLSTLREAGDAWVRPSRPRRISGCPPSAARDGTPVPTQRSCPIERSFQPGTAKKREGHGWRGGATR
jgi:hypothetical protein